MTRLILWCLALGVGTLARAQQPTAAVIRTEVDRYVAAVNGGDAATLAALYLKDAGTTSVGEGAIHHGHAQVATLLRAQVGSMRMAIDSVSILPLGMDAAVAVFRYRWTLGNAPGMAQTGAMTLVYTRTARGWRVAHDHTSTLAGAAPSAVSVNNSGPAGPRRATQRCLITRIVDGDTVDCAELGRVRLIGMDTPEQSQAPFGAQATEALASMIPVGTTVALEPDVEARDRSGRLLGYLWHDSVMVNWRMVREGWGVLLTYAPNVQYVDFFTTAERSAREERRGLWAVDAFACLPRDHRAQRCR